MSGEPASRAIAARRSVRRFAPATVDPRVIHDLVALACLAPAPHHSRPWRFVHIATPDARDALADAMADAWRADLDRAGRSVHDIDRLLGRSRRQVSEAPALLLACLCLGDASEWPDGTRRLAERDMFMQSLGAALQNILLAAGERGLGGYLKGAPLFCRDAVREALDLPPDWDPAFLVLLGYPHESFRPAPRVESAADDFLLER